MKKYFALAAIAVASVFISSASSDDLDLQVVSETANTITYSYPAALDAEGYRYFTGVYQGDNIVWTAVSRTFSPDRLTVKFSKGPEAFRVAPLDVTERADGYSVLARAQCNDKIDNDGDGLIDYPADPGCSRKNDNDESNPPPSDTQTPVILLTSPTDGTTYGGTIPVAANASDNVGVTKVEFFRDGNLIGTDTTSPYSVQFDTTTLSDGTYTFGAKAYDQAGNVGLANQVTANISNTVTPPPPSGDKLLWSPPALTNPTTINVTNSNHSFSLDNSKDYIVKLPSTPLTVSGGLVLIGGHNVVIIGGEISRPTATNSVDGSYGIALYRQTGTVHIEGVWVHGVGIGQAILIAHTDSTSYNSIIQVENSRLESLHTVGDIHTDTIQSYGGPGKLRLYQDTLISNGVTLQTQPCDVGSARPNGWDYRRLNLVHQTPDAYGLWKNCTPWSEYHQDIWYKFNPNHVAASSNAAWAGGNCWPCWNPGGSWPITGEAMHLGLRPEGDFVPVGAAGIGYTSPGYQ